MMIGSIELARTICEELKGELQDGEQYGSVDVAEILSAHVRRLQSELAEAVAANATLHDTCRGYEARLQSLHLGSGGSSDDKNVRDQRENGGALVDQGLRVAHSRMVKAEREAKHIKEANLNLISLDALKEIFDKHFSHPFLENGVVKTKWVKSSTEKTLQVNIGRRDVWINEKGEVTASGTNLLDGVTDANDIRGEICRIVSEMLDNPDKYGIYPTTRCYDQLEFLIKHLRMQIGYLAGELQIAGDKRSTPEIVETAARACA